MLMYVLIPSFIVIVSFGKENHVIEVLQYSTSAVENHKINGFQHIDKGNSGIPSKAFNSQ